MGAKVAALRTAISSQALCDFGGWLPDMERLPNRVCPGDPTSANGSRVRGEQGEQAHSLPPIATRLPTRYDGRKVPIAANYSLGGPYPMLHSQLHWRAAWRPSADRSQCFSPIWWASRLSPKSRERRRLLR